MRILKPNEMHLAVSALKRGELVAIPTETVYGLAALATNPDAIAKVFAAKQRPKFDPLIVHLPKTTPWRMWAQPATAECAQTTNRLLAAGWPGPLTIVLPRTTLVHDLITSGLNTVALRRPAHPLAQGLLAALGEPVVAPSANRFGRISPTSALDVVAELQSQVPWVLDGGSCAVGLESTILHVNDAGDVHVLRYGGWTIEAIEKVVGKPLIPPSKSHTVAAPGQLKSHYAPNSPLLIWNKHTTQPTNRTVWLQVVGLSEMPAHWSAKAVLLAPTGSLEEAATKLFSTMRALDEQYETIVVRLPSQQTGLGFAITDRLQRAAHPFIG